MYSVDVVIDDRVLNNITDMPTTTTTTNTTTNNKIKHNNDNNGVDKSYVVQNLLSIVNENIPPPPQNYNQQYHYTNNDNTITTTPTTITTTTTSSTTKMINEPQDSEDFSNITVDTILQEKSSQDATLTYEFDIDGFNKLLSDKLQTQDDLQTPPPPPVQQQQQEPVQQQQQPVQQQQQEPVQQQQQELHRPEVIPQQQLSSVNVDFLNATERPGFYRSDDKQITHQNNKSLSNQLISNNNNILPANALSPTVNTSPPIGNILSQQQQQHYYLPGPYIPNHNISVSASTSPAQQHYNPIDLPYYRSKSAIPAYAYFCDNNLTNQQNTQNQVHYLKFIEHNLAETSIYQQPLQQQQMLAHQQQQQQPTTAFTAHYNINNFVHPQYHSFTKHRYMTNDKMTVSEQNQLETMANGNIAVVTTAATLAISPAITTMAAMTSKKDDEIPQPCESMPILTDDDTNNNNVDNDIMENREQMCTSPTTASAIQSIIPPPTPNADFNDNDDDADDNNNNNNAIEMRPQKTIIQISPTTNDVEFITEPAKVTFNKQNNNNKNNNNNNNNNKIDNKNNCASSDLNDDGIQISKYISDTLSDDMSNKSTDNESAEEISSEIIENVHEEVAEEVEISTTPIEDSTTIQLLPNSPTTKSISDDDECEFEEFRRNSINYNDLPDKLRRSITTRLNTVYKHSKDVELSDQSHRLYDYLQQVKPEHQFAVKARYNLILSKKKSPLEIDYDLIKEFCPPRPRAKRTPKTKATIEDSDEPIEESNDETMKNDIKPNQVIKSESESMLEPINIKNDKPKPKISAALVIDKSVKIPNTNIDSDVQMHELNVDKKCAINKTKNNELKNSKSNLNASESELLAEEKLIINESKTSGKLRAMIQLKNLTNNNNDDGDDDDSDDESDENDNDRRSKKVIKKHVKSNDKNISRGKHMSPPCSPTVSNIYESYSSSSGSSGSDSSENEHDDNNNDDDDNNNTKNKQSSDDDDKKLQIITSPKAKTKDTTKSHTIIDNKKPRKLVKKHKKHISKEYIEDDGHDDDTDPFSTEGDNDKTFSPTDADGNNSSSSDDGIASKSSKRRHTTAAGLLQIIKPKTFERRERSATLANRAGRKPIETKSIISLDYYVPQFKYKKPSYGNLTIKNLEPKKIKLNLFEYDSTNVIELKNSIKMRPLKFPTVTFSDDPDMVAPSSLDIVYPLRTNNLDYSKEITPLSDIVKELQPTNDIVNTSDYFILTKNAKITGQYDHRIVPSIHGRHLHRISNDHFQTTFYTREYVNNVLVTSGAYYFVYGAVPIFMREFVVFMMRHTCMFKNLYLYDGDLEILAFAYWQITSVDLLQWDDDANRSKLKLILERACYLIPDEALKKEISSHANFHNPTYITRQCVLQIKYRFNEIIASLNSLAEKQPKIYTEARHIWYAFMQQADIHHYSCPHTLRIIITNAQKIKKYLSKTIDVYELEYCKFNAKIKFTKEDVNNLLNYLLDIRPSVKKITLLRQQLGTIYTHMTQILANHLYHYGIAINGARITRQHIKGLQGRFIKYTSVNNHNLTNTVLVSKFPAIRTVLKERIESLHALSITSANSNCLIKIDDDVLTAFSCFINSMILFNVQHILEMSIDTINSKPTIMERIVDSLDGFFDADIFTDINQVDNWIQLDDDEDDPEYLANDCLAADEEASIAEYSDDDDESMSDGDYEISKKELKRLINSANKTFSTTNSEYMQNYVNNFKIEPNCTTANDYYNAEEQQALKEGKIKPSKIKPIINHVSVCNSTRVTTSDKNEEGGNNKTNNTKNEKKEIKKRTEEKQEKQQQPQQQQCTFYKKSLSPLKSRSRCVMCNIHFNDKTYYIGQNILVTMCTKCFNRLAEDFNSLNPKFDHAEIKLRIELQYERPIAFDYENNFIKNEDFPNKLSRYSYNRIYGTGPLPHGKRRRQKALSELATSNKKSKKTNDDDKSKVLRPPTLIIDVKSHDKNDRQRQYADEDVAEDDAALLPSDDDDNDDDADDDKNDDGDTTVIDCGIIDDDNVDDDENADESADEQQKLEAESRKRKRSNHSSSSDGRKYKPPMAKIPKIT